MKTLHKVEVKRRLAARISERLAASHEVRPFPIAISKLTAACQDPQSDSRTFESIIECDPALSGKILKLANSPIFSPSSEVTSIAHAASMLGIRRLKSVAMSVAGAEVFLTDVHDQSLSLWKHSIGCASVARHIAGYFPGVDPCEAFLAGVFHDVGKLILFDSVPEEYSEMESILHGDSLVAEEEFYFGTTHESAGVRSAEGWGLPDEIVAAIGWHHRPHEAAADYTVFARVVNLADSLARHWGIGSIESSELAANADLNSGLGVDDQTLAAIEHESRRSFADAVDV